MAEQLLTIKQAAEYLGISARTIYALASAKKVACYRVGPNGGRLQFSQVDLDAYRQSCRVEVENPKPLPPLQVRRKVEPLIQGKDFFGRLKGKVS